MGQYRHPGGLFLLLVSISSLHAAQGTSCPPPPEVLTSDIGYNVSGSANSSLSYFYIGGLFAIHEAGRNQYECGQDIRERGIANMEAFFWAVSTYPARRGRLKDVSIHAFAFDTCSSDAIVGNKLLNLENCVIGYAPTGHPAIGQARVFGYVGPGGNKEAIKAATILTSKQKLLVSYAANSPLLEDENIYNNFLRTVPSANSEIKIISKIIQAFGVSNIQVVYAEPMLLHSLEEILQNDVKNKVIKIVNKQTLTGMSDVSVINSLFALRQYYLVVLLTNPEETQQLLEAAKSQNVKDIFTYVGTSTLGMDSSIFTQFEDEARGAVMVSMAGPTAEAKVDVKDFNTFLQSDPSYSHNPWAEQYFKQTGTKVIGASDPFIPHTIAAVDALLQGVHKVKEKKCGSEGLCSGFTGAADLAGDIQAEMLDPKEELFDPKTRSQFDPKFDILHLRSPVKSGYVKVTEGIGPEDSFTEIDVNELFSYDAEGKPINRALERPEPPVMSSTQLPESSPAPTESTTSPPPVTPPGIREGSWVIVLIILAALGIFLVLMFEIFILYKMVGSPRTAGMSRKRTIWLGQLLMLGIFLCYLTLFAFVPYQTAVTCTLIRLGVGCSYALCFSVLLVKLMIILSSESVGYLKGIFQIIMLFFAWGVQLAVDIEWLILVNPGINQATGTCQQTIKEHVLSLVYVMFLIVFTTLLSIRTHKIVTNHREGFFVGLATGFSIPIWIAWVLFGLIKSDRSYDDPIIAFALFTNATLILVIMFFPKVRQLTSLGVEGIYAEDDKTDIATVLPPGSVYAGSTIIPRSQGPDGITYVSTKQPVPEGSIILLNGGAYSEMGTLRRMPETNSTNALHLRHPGSDSGSLRSVPVNSGLFSTDRGDDIYADTRILNVTNSLTGRFPTDTRKTQSEVRGPVLNRGYIPTRSRGSSPTTVRKFRSVVDLGSL